MGGAASDAAMAALEAGTYVFPYGDFYSLARVALASPSPFCPRVHGDEVAG
jgi:hypothetical protein